MIEHLNLQLFRLMNADITANQTLLNIAILIADYLIYSIPVLLAGLWLWGNPKHRPQLLFATIVTFIALFVNQLIGLAWFHPRPATMGIGHTFITHAADSSFPSDHMTVFWAIGFTLFLTLGIRSISACTLVGAIAVAWSRVYLGVHFPLDMFGAVLISTTCCAVLMPFRPWLDRHVLPLVERCYRTVLAKPLQVGWIRE